ncbi:hypothetical protein F4778DRAFT_259265 [Xylariomycetidae sp. FL2044]|nr:hypothetical protein F4778DRAFT_259265 [Xylariomycetidae sp. FL2044]
MPVRLPKPRRGEIATYGLAGVGAFAPFYFMMPGAEERLASNTAKWAPRWERNISYFAPPAQNLTERVHPHLGRTVNNLHGKLPLERAAVSVDGRIKRGIDRADRYVKK